jgi:hypothetical protein
VVAQPRGGRVHKTGGNRTGSAGSRWYRSGPVLTLKPYLKYCEPSEPAGFTGKPGRFFPNGGRSVHGRVNPAWWSGIDDPPCDGTRAARRLHVRHRG